MFESLVQTLLELWQLFPVQNQSLVRSLFLTANVTLPWHSSVLFPQVLSLSLERRDQEYDYCPCDVHISYTTVSKRSEGNGIYEVASNLAFFFFVPQNSLPLSNSSLYTEPQNGCQIGLFPVAAPSFSSFVGVLRQSQVLLVMLVPFTSSKSAQKAGQLQLDTTTLAFFKALLCFLRISLFQFGEVLYLTVAFVVFINSWELGWQTRMRKRSLIVLVLWIRWLKPWEQIKLKLHFGKCNVIK